MSRSRDQEKLQVVALVASAGGLDALMSVLGPLHEGFPASILVLLHQEPERASRLPDILATRSRLPVQHATHDEPLRAGRVLVAPPGKHMLVTHRLRTALVASGAFPPHRPSADLLLTSMALSLEERAITVVLSGTGTDAATGATVVHDFGGVVLTADQASSQEFAMPRAAIGRKDTVDEILPVSDIADRLNELTVR